MVSKKPSWCAMSVTLSASYTKPGPQLRVDLGELGRRDAVAAQPFDLGQDGVFDGRQRLALGDDGVDRVEKRMFGRQQRAAHSRGQAAIDQRAIQPRAALRPRHAALDQMLRPAAPFRTASATSSGKNVAVGERRRVKRAFQYAVVPSFRSITRRSAC